MCIRDRNNTEQKNIIKSVSDEIKREVIVKSIEFLEGESDLLVKSIKPNFKKLGPTYGKYMKEISTLVNSLDNHSIIELEKTAKIDLLIDKKTITFDIDDFEISSKDIEGWQVANEGNITVALDITINDVLRNEGIAREVVSKIQNLRKLPVGAFISFPAEILRTGANIMMIGLKEAAHPNAAIRQMGLRRLLGAFITSAAAGKGFSEISQFLTGSDQAQWEAYKRSAAAQWDSRSNLLAIEGWKDGESAAINFSYFSPYDSLWAPLELSLIHI